MNVGDLREILAAVDDSALVVVDLDGPELQVVREADIDPDGDILLTL